MWLCLSVFVLLRCVPLSPPPAVLQRWWQETCRHSTGRGRRPHTGGSDRPYSHSGRMELSSWCPISDRQTTWSQHTTREEKCWSLEHNLVKGCRADTPKTIDECGQTCRLHLYLHLSVMSKYPGVDFYIMASRWEVKPQEVSKKQDFQGTVTYCLRNKRECFGACLSLRLSHLVCHSPVQPQLLTNPNLDLVASATVKHGGQC